MERTPNRSWWIIAALIVAWPIGLALMWRFSGWQVRTKRIVTGALVWPLGAWWLTRDRRRSLLVKSGAWVGAAVWALLAVAVAAALINPSERVAKQEVAASDARATATAASPAASATQPPTTRSATATAAATSAPTASPTTAPTTSTPAPATTTADLIREYLRGGFGMPGYETSWYGSVKEIRVVGRTVTVLTDLFPDAEGKRFAVPICGSVSGFVYSNTNTQYGLSAVEVLGQSNRRLVYRANLSARCE